MAIKLYKSQLTPTAADSNVADTRQINLGEAQSIGKAMKGMLQSGENLYIKHLDIKSDNELIEKSKEIMRHAEDIIWHIRTRFDEAFTKYEHSNPHNRKLKDFEIHEKRDQAKEYCYSLSSELRDEIKSLENGVLKYGIDIKDPKDDVATGVEDIDE